MLKAWRLFLIFGLWLGLSACQKHDENYYLTHPSQISAPYKRCINQSSLSAPMAGECVVVIKAASQLRTLFMALVKNQEAFGLALLQEQAKLADLQATLEKDKKILAESNHNKDTPDFIEQVKQQTQSLEKAIATQKINIQSRIAVIRLISKRMG